MACYWRQSDAAAFVVGFEGSGTVTLENNGSPGADAAALYHPLHGFPLRQARRVPPGRRPRARCLPRRRSLLVGRGVGRVQDQHGRGAWHPRPFDSGVCGVATRPTYAPSMFARNFSSTISPSVARWARAATAFWAASTMSAPVTTKVVFWSSATTLTL